MMMLITSRQGKAQARMFHKKTPLAGVARGRGGSQRGDHRLLLNQLRFRFRVAIQPKKTNDDVNNIATGESASEDVS
ncbi:hypothetical protein CP989_25050 [Enterobacter hormaechei]|nr:hypothetical protein CP989_25050 [Enterobacter hormaechei]